MGSTKYLSPKVMSPSEALHIVVGGGIGGLASALALSQRGFRVLVLERARQFSEIGAGIQLGPNVWPMFEKLAVAEEIKAQTVFPDQLVTMDAVSGQQIPRIPLKDKFLKRFRYPYGLIHRADLHSVLLRQCETSPLVQLMTSQKVSGCVDNGDSVTVEVEDDAIRLRYADRSRRPLVHDSPAIDWRRPAARVGAYRLSRRSSLERRSGAFTNEQHDVVGGPKQSPRSLPDARVEAVQCGRYLSKRSLHGRLGYARRRR